MAKRILVPVETNDDAEPIVPLAAALAREAGGTVRLLNVQPVPRTRFTDAAPRAPRYDFDAGIPDAADRVLAYGHVLEERVQADVIERLRALEPLLDGVAVERVVRFGDVADEIAREADAFGADLVAVAERRRPWWRPSLARVVDRVRARVRVPVLALSGGAR